MDRKHPIYLIWPQFALCSSRYKITRGLTKKLRFLPIFWGGKKGPKMSLEESSVEAQPYRDRGKSCTVWLMVSEKQQNLTEPLRGENRVNG